jgi:hypothetical protein
MRVRDCLLHFFFGPVYSIYAESLSLLRISTPMDGLVWYGNLKFKLTFPTRYMVLVLYRGTHIRPRLIINPPHCTVIIQNQGVR